MEEPDKKSDSPQLHQSSVQTMVIPAEPTTPEAETMTGLPESLTKPVSSQVPESVNTSTTAAPAMVIPPPQQAFSAQTNNGQGPITTHELQPHIAHHGSGGMGNKWVWLIIGVALVSILAVLGFSMMKSSTVEPVAVPSIAPTTQAKATATPSAMPATDSRTKVSTGTDNASLDNDLTVLQKEFDVLDSRQKAANEDLSKSDSPESL